jgi:hypothetical protein
MEQGDKTAGLSFRLLGWGILHRALTVLLVAALAGCAAPPPPPASLSTEEREEFRQEMLANIDKVDTFLQKTRRGVNLTEITLGWFAMILLDELSARDAGLHAHIHRDDRNAELYLRNDFQTDPAREIATLETMARQGAGDIRMAAREVLACLTTIPSHKTPDATQKAARSELAAALVRLRGHLERIAANQRNQTGGGPPDSGQK